MNLKTLVEGFFIAGSAAAGGDDMVQLHAFRVSAKRLRYTIDILKLKHSKQGLEKLKKIQDMIGAAHDAAVAASYLRQLPSLSKRVGKVPAKLDAKSKRFIGAFRKYWKAEFASNVKVEEWIEWAEASSTRRSS